MLYACRLNDENYAATVHLICTMQNSFLHITNQCSPNVRSPS